MDDDANILEVTIDSGTRMARQIRAKPSNGSDAGVIQMAANGAEVPNQVEKEIKMQMAEDHMLKIQVMAARK